MTCASGPGGSRRRGRAMTVLRPVRVAAVQATPVVLDATASVEKAVRLLEQAADDGAELAVLPETFVPLYPSGRWAQGRRAASAGSTSCGSGCGSNSVDVPGPARRRARRRLRPPRAALRDRRQRARIRAARLALQHDAHARARRAAAPPPQAHADPARAPLPRHRPRRRPAASSTRRPAASAGSSAGRTGCRWPAASSTAPASRSTPRPTADDSDGWLATMRHIAIESGAFVVSAPQFIPGSAFPADFPVAGGAGHGVRPRRRLHRRSDVGRDRRRAALRRRRHASTFDCDLRHGLHAKRWFDAVGHYSRDDVLPVRQRRRRSTRSSPRRSVTRSASSARAAPARSGARCRARRARARA